MGRGRYGDYRFDTMDFAWVPVMLVLGTIAFLSATGLTENSTVARAGALGRDATMAVSLLGPLLATALLRLACERTGWFYSRTEAADELLSDGRTVRSFVTYDTKGRETDRWAWVLGG